MAQASCHGSSPSTGGTKPAAPGRSRPRTGHIPSSRQSQERSSLHLPEHGLKRAYLSKFPFQSHQRTYGHLHICKTHELLPVSWQYTINSLMVLFPAAAAVSFSKRHSCMLHPFQTHKCSGCQCHLYTNTASKAMEPWHWTGVSHSSIYGYI